MRPKTNLFDEKRQGKDVDVSNHNLEEIKLTASISAEEGLSVLQNHYSLLCRSYET
ncbi:hypothetical protein QUF84_00945 [Fictibacillus enclensis]|uniref:hypothetical protein n=1 Tax=Fictibacillus enclensis TaxID=1017270 RepID=UPI0024BFAEA8|nr:hypothetical protein [Fictibacillus enclensis]MDM5196623.1 hypothetical protein [Fictibacillus enclensis]MDM5335864.1 hypothetical protein [Fictibacillus enclensis]WHY71211.1 hypothetical protein QNH15_19655 [Fictibacillus enclensis]